MKSGVGGAGQEEKGGGKEGERQQGLQVRLRWRGAWKGRPAMQASCLPRACCGCAAAPWLHPLLLRRRQHACFEIRAAVRLALLHTLGPAEVGGQQRLVQLAGGRELLDDWGRWCTQDGRAYTRSHARAGTIPPPSVCSPAAHTGAPAGPAPGRRQRCRRRRPAPPGAWAGPGPAGGAARSARRRRPTGPLRCGWERGGTRAGAACELIGATGYGRLKLCRGSGPPTLTGLGQREGLHSDRHLVRRRWRQWSAGAGAGAAAQPLAPNRQGDAEAA